MMYGDGRQLSCMLPVIKLTVFLTTVEVKKYDVVVVVNRIWRARRTEANSFLDISSTT